MQSLVNRSVAGRGASAAARRGSRTRLSVVVRAAVEQSRRSVLAGLVAVPAALALDAWRPAFAAGANVGEEGVEEYSRLEASGKLNTIKDLEKIRTKFNFKRGTDGRVYARSSKGTWFAVRLDMEVPGAMLFRDTSNGEIFALQTQALQQIDLSSDQVVILLLGDGDWEREISPITFDDGNGNTKSLVLTENEFRNVVGLISMAEAAEEGAEGAK
ncbi:hypothetical protein HYH03_015454 [Edaphochlamys debaryana]|uniref:Uncharacterized protein n=1 Tax=Edaphochlamys debaryana TaxID=47281 RepID=A0A835XPD6_9CHLO|nr:hypothetical protein HYH03_015454 [Edaphochlamys debaryana]|eukprot:KAG2485871.1 hypothetical protein HYH03_015454 [Edaphochlamys debaryana]